MCDIMWYIPILSKYDTCSDRTKDGRNELVSSTQLVWSPFDRTSRCTRTICSWRAGPGIQAERPAETQETADSALQRSQDEGSQLISMCTWGLDSTPNLSMFFTEKMMIFHRKSDTRAGPMVKQTRKSTGNDTNRVAEMSHDINANFRTRNR